ncbi:uncharacterized protein BT62DRAFT_333355 [Guyanagaster necrorhizus]|uniref:Uncharacterized protein n=1 Tax=Guyanagaster necrorhizus TaxID=856835 RepID=A0A9P8AR38_9AGAR|nr:uncharacterized protein BT62DRAFT_333355 [Guyanagaster necrorhizus MCA 3950]KAG7443482.1 hypothetical protein BT62DRAFT_333355 [Guyanagaster necrorhizus MCA 3950]
MPILPFIAVRQWQFTLWRVYFLPGMRRKRHCFLLYLPPTSRGDLLALEHDWRFFSALIILGSHCAFYLLFRSSFCPSDTAPRTRNVGRNTLCLLQTFYTQCLLSLTPKIFQKLHKFVGVPVLIFIWFLLPISHRHTDYFFTSVLGL